MLICHNLSSSLLFKDVNIKMLIFRNVLYVSKDLYVSMMAENTMRLNL